MTRYLVLLETASNQKYIFATNKLRENVGASELTFRAGKTWVDGAAKNVSGVEIILATSGKAYLLAESEDAAKSEAAAKEVVRKVTTKALKDAPGIDLSGIYVKIDGDDFDEAIKSAHKKLAERRCTNPGPESRFRRLPVVAECATSGLPANTFDEEKPEPGPRSAQSLWKRKVVRAGIGRMRKIAWNYSGLDIVRSVDDLDRVEKRSWIAVVHADGNGLGKVFLKFAKHIPKGADYVVELRKFSHALDECTYQAFGAALKKLKVRIDKDCRGKNHTDDDPLPVVPIVLGGDDMTVVMDGIYAVQFAIDFLAAFEDLTKNHEYIPGIMRGRDETGPDRVTACAGAAVMKPHFPFYAAYELAEELIKSAKKFAKGPDEAKPLSRSALEFHILYDASGADLTRIRKEMEPDGVTNLLARPYLVDSDATNPCSTAMLNTLMGVIRGKNEDGRRAIPNSQLHDLREALFLGRTVAEARYELLRQRYEEFKDLLPQGLFWPKDGTVQRTHLLDAIDLVEFWHTPEDKK